jgi:hypothetical protein
MRTKKEFEDFYERYILYWSASNHSEDDWEYFIPKMKMFEIARRIKSIPGFVSEYYAYKQKELGYRIEYKKEEIIEDFFQFCRSRERNIGLRKKIDKLKKGIDGTE